MQNLVQSDNNSWLGPGTPAAPSYSLAEDKMLLPLPWMSPLQPHLTK